MKIKKDGIIQEIEGGLALGIFDSKGTELFSDDTVVNDNYPGKSWSINYVEELAAFMLFSDTEMKKALGFISSITSSKNSKILAPSFYIKQKS